MSCLPAGPPGQGIGCLRDVHPIALRYLLDEGFSYGSQEKGGRC
jgi:hypothetical protein